MADDQPLQEASFEFLGRLDQFLVPATRSRCLRVTFRPVVSLKHLVEALGVPHTEVGLIMANEKMVNLEYRVQPGDNIIAHPAVATGGCEPPTFLLDNHLGKLASYLRILGFDSLYRNDFQDNELADLASQTGRILLTRDRHLLMRKAVSSGFCLQSLDPHQQLAEVLQRYDLAALVQSFQRCPRCNGLLEQVDKDRIVDRLEPLTNKYYQDFHRCLACAQIYWEGSHFERMQSWIPAALSPFLPVRKNTNLP